MNGISNMYGFDCVDIKSMRFLKCLGLIAWQEDGNTKKKWATALLVVLGSNRRRRRRNNRGGCGF